MRVTQHQKNWENILRPTFFLLHTHCPHTQLPCLLHIVVLSLGSLKHDCKVLLGLIKLLWSHRQLSPKKPSLHMQIAHSNVPFLLHLELFFWAALVHSQSHKYLIFICTSPKPEMVILALWRRKYNSLVSATFHNSPQAKHRKLPKDFGRVKIV